MRIAFYYDNKARIEKGMEPIEGSGSVDVPVADQSEEIRGEMAAMGEDVLRRTKKGNIRYDTLPSVALLIDGTTEEAVAVLEENAEVKREVQAERREKAAEKLAAETAEAEKWIALPVEERVSRNSYTGRWYVSDPSCGSVPALRAALDLAIPKAQAEADHRNDALEAERVAAETKKEAEEAARQVAIIIMLRKHGTASQVERYEAEVLPGKEVKAIVRKLLMGTLNDAGYDRYGPIGDAVEHADHCDGGDYCEVCYTEDPLETLSANQWANLKRARELAPDCTITAVLHRAWASCNEDVETQRPALAVEGEMHGIKVSRNYELADEPIPENLVTDADNQEARR